MQVFEKDGKILAKLITNDDWVPGLGFFSNDNDFIQVGTWFYNAGKQLANHVHYEFDRVAKRTYETVHMVNGSMKVRLYTLEKVFVTDFVISKGETLILLESGHGYEILEEDTKVLEIKNGPFMGVDKDKEKF
ncbi:MAG: hypothetical protein WC366_03785 [Bacilli bacterium]|jgi:hypothetical protein